MTIGYILSPNPQVLRLAHDIRAAAARLGAGEHRTVPYRMSEGNTCYRGGKPGVSDVFAASLWAADYFLELASFGYAGVNLHGGGGKAVANGLGGKLPGDLLMKDSATPHPHPFYTPIAEIDGAYMAEPVFYGMLFAGHFAGAAMLPLDFNPGPVNATAYAALLPTGRHIVAIVNKDATQALHLDLDLDLDRYRLGLTLSAPALDSTHVHLAEAQPSKLSRPRGVSTVPPATAVLYASKS